MDNRARQLLNAIGRWLDKDLIWQLILEQQLAPDCEKPSSTRGGYLNQLSVEEPAKLALLKSSRRTRSRSPSICSGVVPTTRTMHSVMDSATSASPEKTVSAPACLSSDASRKCTDRAKTRILGLSSLARRISSWLLGILAVLRMRLVAVGTAACSNVSRCEASPY